jgi:protein-S-isoprenylcysteine O-methyltransferase Ste14
VQFLELKIPPPAVAALIGAGMWYAAQYGPFVQWPLQIRIALLVALALAGGAIALAGEREFRRARTTVNPFRPGNATTLVTSGIYRFTRNPMYAGIALVVLGWAAFLGSALALLGPVAFVLYISRFQIAPEERILSEKFGQAYAEYAARVRRW